MKKLLITMVFLCIVTSLYCQLNFVEDYYGNTTVTDGYGTLIARGSKDYYGNYIWQDPYGNILFTQTKDYYGNIITKDAYGNVVATYRKGYYDVQLGSQASFGGVQVFNVPKTPIPNVGSIPTFPAPGTRRHK